MTKFVASLHVYLAWIVASRITKNMGGVFGGMTMVVRGTDAGGSGRAMVSGKLITVIHAGSKRHRNDAEEEKRSELFVGR